MPSSLSHAHILVADTDDQRGTYSRCFGTNGWSFDFYCDGREALVAAGQKSYDLIISSLVMPGIEGLQFIRSVRDKTPSPPMIVVMGKDFGVVGNGLSEVIASLKAGVSEVLQKPLDRSALVATIQRVLSSSKDAQVAFEEARYLSRYSMSYELTSRELSKYKFQLLVEDSLCRVGRLDKAVRCQLELAFQEALANSLEHGNLELLSAWREEVNEEGVDRYSEVKKQRLHDDHFGLRKIALTLGLEGDRLSISIKDNGPGFDVPAPKLATDPNQILCHGRGLSIIDQCMDEVAYAEGGTRITMVKNLSAKGE